MFRGTGFRVCGRRPTRRADAALSGPEGLELRENGKLQSNGLFSPLHSLTPISHTA